jgi:hypothetical protein
LVPLNTAKSRTPPLTMALKWRDFLETAALWNG